MVCRYFNQCDTVSRIEECLMTVKKLERPWFLETRHPIQLVTNLMCNLLGKIAWPRVDAVVC